MAVVSGTVKDSAGNFAQRPVRVYRRSDGAFAGAAISDAVTGVFSIPSLDSTAHMAIALPVDGDPYWNNVVLAMHMDDTGLTDLKGHTVTLNGNAARSSAQSKFGGYSAMFDGAGDYLTTPSATDFNFGSGDFTVEFFVYLTSVTTAGLLAFGPSGYVPVLVYCVSSEFRLYAASNGASSWDVASAVAFKTGVAAGQWYHIAICRRGSEIRCICDGVVGATVTTSATLAASATALHIGDWAGSNFLDGHIDDLRITKGIARYAQNSTPPSAAFPHAITSGVENALIFDNITPV